MTPAPRPLIAALTAAQWIVGLTGTLILVAIPFLADLMELLSCPVR